VGKLLPGHLRQSRREHVSVLAKKGDLSKFVL
jgi:hypothetical protein